tara:strand:- start:122 stop:226 length:105 start_codon:yes stop_codon:yes gene_type:complete
MADKISAEALSKKAFWITMIGAVLYIGTVIAFVL